MNKLDKQYTDLLQDILDNGVTKKDRTGTGTISVFGRQIRHKMSDGFPLLTTKKMHFKSIVTELLWFLRGDTDIRFLWKNNCSIWDGDWYKQYISTCSLPYSLDEIKKYALAGDTLFHDSTWDLGPIYGKQWRSWTKKKMYLSTDGTYENIYDEKDQTVIDQISILINDLKTNPDSRRLMVNAWNVGELDQMVLPPCHYSFQVYTRELTFDERKALVKPIPNLFTHGDCDVINLPKRAISLMWNQRSVDTPLGLPFNIASYALLLEIIAKMVNMIPDELIGNLGDCHIYLNQIDGVKEQIGRELSLEERKQIFEDRGYVCDLWPFNGDWSGEYDGFGIPKHTREPYPLPNIIISDEVNFKGTIDDFLDSCSKNSFKLHGYQSHTPIKIPLSN